MGRGAALYPRACCRDAGGCGRVAGDNNLCDLESVVNAPEVAYITIELMPDGAATITVTGEGGAVKLANVIVEAFAVEQSGYSGSETIELH